MNREQKMAWFTLIMMGSGLVLSLAAVSAAYFGFGLPIRRAVGGFAFSGVIGLSGLAPVLFKKHKGKVELDERDVLIKRKALLGAYSIFWFLFVLAAMIPFFVLGPKGKVGVWYLACVVLGGMFVVMLVQSIVTLEEYGWREKREKS